MTEIPAQTRAELAACLPSSTEDLLAWLARHGLSDTPGIGAVLPAIRRDILGICSACPPPSVTLTLHLRQEAP